MAQQDRNTLKTFFQTGDKPTQQQFWDWLDSFVHNTDAIPQSRITGLTDALPTAAQLQAVEDLEPKDVTINGSGTYQIPAGKLLQHIVFMVNTNNVCKAGFSLNSGEIFDDNVTTAQHAIANYTFYFQSQTTIHFTGNCTVKIYLR